MMTSSNAPTSIVESIPANPGIEFGYCGVGQTSTKTFTLVNPGTSLIRYEILSENKHFEISPSKGVLGGKQKQEITIKFEPSEAVVVIATAIFKFFEGEETSKVLKLSAIGKYPFLTINRERIDFETLLVGKQTTKDILLKNESLVPVLFTVEKVSDDGKDVSFSIDYYEGTIPPHAIFKITVKYVPSIVGQTSCAAYKIKTVGGNEREFTCVGMAAGFNVSLSVKSIHFGEVQLESNTNRLLNIVNESDLPTSFQFSNDNKNVFSFSKLEGTVNAKSSTRIIVTFNPQQTVNYYERVFCVVRNHQVLYVDLIGTCYDILTKPIPLLQRHVDIYRHKVIMGIHNKVRKHQPNPDMLSLDDDKLGNSLIHNQSFDDEVEVNLEIPIDDPNQVVLHKEMFLEISSENRDIKLREDYLDFGFTEKSKVSEHKQITVDNKFPFEVQLDWVLLKVENKTTGQLVDNPFRVVPNSATVPANGSYTFTVKFAPYEADSYFFQIAQCFAQLQNGNQNKVKKMSIGGSTGGTGAAGATLNGTLTQVGGKTLKSGGKTLLSSLKKTKNEEAFNEELDPPTCLNLRLVGHSFPPGSQPFIPMVKISPSNKVIFPAAGVNESVYQTVQIVNTSDTPVYFRILADPTKTFRSFPQIGMINGKSFTLICFEFLPKNARFYNFTAQCMFNHSAASIQSIHLVGYCYSPALSIANNAKLFFPPTFMGVSSKQRFDIKNDARIPVEFEWKVPDKYKTEVIFEPNKAYLLPNETTKVLATFTPLKKKEYIIDIPVYATNVQDHIKNLIGFYNPGSGAIMQNITKAQMKAIAPQTVRYDLQIIGAGSDGVVSITPKELSFGTITVGFSKTLSVQVINKSNSNLYIELKMAQKIDENTKARASELPQMTKILQECFKFDNPKGLINAKSKKKVNITFKPTLRFDFDIHLVCIAREKPSKEVQAVKNSTMQGEQIIEKSYISIHAMGDFPLLRFTDVRNDAVSTPTLWERFHLTNLNKELLTPLNDSEIEFNNSDKTNQSVNDLQKNLRIFTWDFGKIPIQQGPKLRKITLTLKNIGGVRSDWCLKMPNDSEIELEPWADPGEPSDEQAFERHILENKIFHIEPRKGALDPGQQMDLSVYYFPREVKLHYLKVFFSIQNGKPLILNFQGQTLQNRKVYLQLLKDVYHLPPVPIGLEWAVTYPIEIKNLGNAKLKYSIDTTALEQLNTNNYDFRVFEIQNPEGMLIFNETQYIYTLFRPLEAKEYSLDLPIKISDFEGPTPEQYTLKLRGMGYHFEDRKPKEVPFYEDLPKCRANLNENGSMAAFSIEEIDFGELEKEQLSRRFVVLYNLHPTQKLKFEFYKSGLMCGDNIKLEPMQGELKPNSHQNIKMTLVSARFPTHFEGEIQCMIEWESDDLNKQEMKSVHTSTALSDTQEFLFLRLKKRSKITKMPVGVENREGESLIENIIIEAMHDVLESDQIEDLMNDCQKNQAVLYEPYFNNAEPVSCDKFDTEFEEIRTKYVNENSEKYEAELRTVSGLESQDIFRKRMFLESNFTNMLEFMLEDTIFNLMEEATYEEFDLTQAPKIYIRKDDLKLQPPSNNS